MTMSAKEIVEDILGEFGFRVKWEYTNYYATCSVYEMVAYISGENIPRFIKKDWEILPDDDTENIDEAEIYIQAYVKWDVSTEIQGGSILLGSLYDYKKHIALIEYIYRRAFELMGREPDKKWEDVNLLTT